MNPIDILIEARVEEAIAKGIGPGARMIAMMVGSTFDNEVTSDEGVYYIFCGGELQINAGERDQSVAIHLIHAGMKKVFEQSLGKVELFIPGDWEEGFRYLLSVAVRERQNTAKRAYNAAKKKQSENEARMLEHWKM